MEKFIKRWQDFLANMNAPEGYSHSGDNSMDAAKPPARQVPGDPEIKGDSVFNEPFNGGGTSAHDDRNEEVDDPSDKSAVTPPLPSVPTCVMLGAGVGAK